MTDEQIEKLVQLMPPNEQEEARCRIQRASLDGIEAIGIWDGVDSDGNFLPPDVTDLFGNCPRYRKELRAQGDNFSSGMISLERYASE